MLKRYFRRQANIREVRRTSTKLSAYNFLRQVVESRLYPNFACNVGRIRNLRRFPTKLDATPLLMLIPIEDEEGAWHLLQEIDEWREDVWKDTQGEMVNS